MMTKKNKKPPLIKAKVHHKFHVYDEVQEKYIGANVIVDVLTIHFSTRRMRVRYWNTWREKIITFDTDATDLIKKIYENFNINTPL